MRYIPGFTSILDVDFHRTLHTLLSNRYAIQDPETSSCGDMCLDITFNLTAHIMNVLQHHFFMDVGFPDDAFPFLPYPYKGCINLVLSNSDQKICFLVCKSLFEDLPEFDNSFIGSFVEKMLLSKYLVRYNDQSDFQEAFVVALVSESVFRSFSACLQTKIDTTVFTFCLHDFSRNLFDEFWEGMENQLEEVETVKEETIVCSLENNSVIETLRGTYRLLVIKVLPDDPK